MSEDLAALRAAVVARCGSLHKFCRVTGLCRSTVYLAFAGKYPGDTRRTRARIAAALSGLDATGPFERVYRAIETEACGGCRMANDFSCRQCRERFARQARAVLAALEMEDV